MTFTYWSQSDMSPKGILERTKKQIEQRMAQVQAQIDSYKTSIAEFELELAECAEMIVPIDRQIARLTSEEIARTKWDQLAQESPPSVSA
jgi:septal ring factor EnvC (AmiA/AmiB activator)